ncbi:hypothetical protein CPJ18_04035 [Agrobacterium rosae]|uniref:Uncharacterized protein n=1 Tax=Agrobacterium rosae TaxID=1972867 RepID=A0AAE5VQT8_9HYPH|nr:hypothetical protein DXM21_08795 [Agrobacterium rosae]KAA3521425.1 hypothetical protein DXM25_09185 [Agrobacterium rosae]MQB48329.1 hypothetical protein [Agrobacterium rosae]POO53413.1 hypothetical protein CPJ18_04035 [Agrobacterium rosae]
MLFSFLFRSFPTSRLALVHFGPEKFIEGFGRTYSASCPAVSFDTPRLALPAAQKTLRRGRPKRGALTADVQEHAWRAAFM